MQESNIPESTATSQGKELPEQDYKCVKFADVYIDGMFAAPDMPYFRCIWCERVFAKEDLGASFAGKKKTAYTYSLCKSCFSVPYGREGRRKYMRQIMAKITSIRSGHNPPPKKKRKK